MGAPDKLFAAHVTQVAFNLSLSRNMVFVLEAISRGCLASANMRAQGMIDTAVPSMGRLKARGLVWAPDPEWPGRCELTEAGKHVLALLRIAGLVADGADMNAAA